MVPDTVRDLLFIAANEGSHYAWCVLKKYDGQHSHLVSVGSTISPGKCSVTSQTRARRARSSADASTSAATSIKDQAAGGPQGQQGAELMEQLMLTSLLSDDDCEAHSGLRRSADKSLLFNLASDKVAKGLGKPLSDVLLEGKKTASEACISILAPSLAAAGCCLWIPGSLHASLRHAFDCS